MGAENASTERPSDASTYFATSDYYKLWVKEVRRGTVGRPPIPAKLSLGDLVLEIGVGEGRVMRYVFTTSKPRLYIGLDISSDILRFLRGRGDIYIELVQADGLYLPVRDRALTCVLCIATSHYILDKARLFLEVYRALKEKGVFLSNFKDLSRLHIALQYHARNLLNNLLRYKTLRKLLYHSCRMVVILFNRLGLKRYGLDPDWLKSIFTYGVTPYYPIRRKDCIRMLMMAGFDVRWIIDRAGEFIALSVK